MPRPRRTINRRRAALDGANAPAENQTDYSAMSTEALRLTLGERHLQQTGNRRELISRLQQNEQHRPPASQPESGPSNSSVATGVPNAELAALIASIVDERMNRHCSNDQLARPSPPSNLQSHGPSPPLPPQDGGQNTTCQVPTSSLRSSPAGNLLPNTAVPSGLTASSGLGSLSSPADFSDPAQVASLHPNFRQPSLASHLTKTTSSAITNGPGMPLPNPTCATTLTKADPAPASHALTNTGVTSRDAQQLTLGKSTLNSPATERTDLNRLQALAIPPEDTPKYLSQLTPPN